MNWQLVQSVLWENKGLPWLLPPPLTQGHSACLRAMREQRAPMAPG